jgi:hypothetical protein
LRLKQQTSYETGVEHAQTKHYNIVVHKSCEIALIIVIRARGHHGADKNNYRQSKCHEHYNYLETDTFAHNQAPK